MAKQVTDPLYIIMRAQAQNIARIDIDVQVDATDGEGEPVKLWGPKPDLIRLYDTPLRFIEGAAMTNWQRIITLNPLMDADAAGRAVNRNDRTVKYQVNLLVRLLESEILEDRKQILDGSLRPDNPLALKASKLASDFHHVFFDNQLLITEDCTNGVVDDQQYTMNWEPTIDYPFSMFTAEITAERSGD